MDTKREMERRNNWEMEIRNNWNTITYCNTRALPVPVPVPT
jgi:hypothetical protein